MARKPDLKKRAERNNKVQRLVAKINQTVAKLERMKDEYMRSAVSAKARGETASYNIAKNGLNITLTQIKRAREMLLNIEITSELQRMGETNADFLSGMSVIAKSISKINRKSDFVKLQKEIEKALSGMEEAQAGLDGFMRNTDAAFAAISASPGALTDAEIDKLIAGQVSEKELLMDEQLDRLIHGVAAPSANKAERELRVEAGEPRNTSTLVAQPFAAPQPAPDFSAKRSPLIGVDAFRSFDTEAARTVALADVIESDAGDGLTVVVGRNADGDAVRLDFERTPHVLVGGAVGSGKSMLLHAVTVGLAVLDTAERVRLLLFDLKSEELTAYNGMAHLAMNVVTDGAYVLPAMNELKRELERRYELFASAGVRDIKAYNKVATVKLPYIVAEFDEYSDAVSASDGFERAYLSLVRQSAGAGIYTMLCTRNVAQNVVTSAIRANTDMHIAFKLATGEQSALILGRAGAETLSGAGAFLCDGCKTAVQAAAVSKREIERTVGALKGGVL